MLLLYLGKVNNTAAALIDDNFTAELVGLAENTATACGVTFT